MPTLNYRIVGKLTTTLAGASLNDLKVFAYTFLSSSTMQNFGAASVDVAGVFTLEFSRSSGSGSPQDVDIMPVPTDIEQFGVFNIERTIIGLFFPKVHIRGTDWVLSRGVYTYKAKIEIPDHIWKRWAWLGQEFTVFGRAMKQVDEALLPLPFTWVSAADVDSPLPYGAGVGGAQTDELGNFTITFRRISFFIDYARKFPALPRQPYGTEAWPDLIFQITQVINGIKTSIYQETHADARPQSMWDVPGRMLFVTLVSEEGITNDEIYPPIPENFLFHGIGVIDPHSLTDGYATTGPTEDLPNLKDSPFGGTLHIKGQFDTTTPNPPRYYQVLYALWSVGTSPDPSDFTPMANETWTASRYDSVTHDWKPESIAPVSHAVPGELVYEIPDYTDITLTKKTRLISWTTTRSDGGFRRYPDGKYDLLIKAWDGAGNPVPLNPMHPKDNRLTVVIDNSRPTALLKRLGTHDILRTDEMYPYTPVCPVFSKAGDGPLMTVEFDATDELHMYRYHLSFITGHNFWVDEVIKHYDGKAGANELFRAWAKHRMIGTPAPLIVNLPNEVKPVGGFPSETISWNIGSPDVVKCAYQVRLVVWDRTINGYGHIHRVEDSMHFSIEP